MATLENANNFFLFREKRKSERPLGKQRRRSEDNIKMDIVYDDVDSNHLAEGKDQKRAA
jgi:hypothetical protein